MACCWEGHQLAQSSTPPPQEQSLELPSRDWHEGEGETDDNPRWLQLLIPHSQDDAVPEDDVYGSRKFSHTLVHAGTMTSYNNSRVSDYWMWLQ